MLDAVKQESFRTDYVVFVAPIQRSVALMTVEVKAPGSEKRSENGSNDFIKLGKEMKAMVDTLIALDVAQPVVCGLLVEGLYIISSISMCSLMKTNLIFRL